MLLHTHEPLKFAFSTTDHERIPELSFGIMGAPFDSTTTYVPGARFGPMAVREASYSFEAYNLRFSEKVNVKSFDFGDVEVSPGNFMKTAGFIGDSVAGVLDMDLKPIIIGGEHTVTLPVIENLPDHDSLTVVHLDAHMDMADTYAGERYSHATVMRRVHELGAEIIQIGVRSASEEEAEFAVEEGVRCCMAHEVMGDPAGAIELIDGIRGPVYISVDMDVLDPAYAPSVGNPAPSGLTPHIMEELVLALSGKDVVGLDVVEVASAGVADPTSVNAAKIIYDLLTLL
ncbi:agmatinase [Methanothermobacter thermautotrophicus]|uniref:Agmatinase n=1 Tax=Methanothermobacter thermautotrophicus TaxID=145262 RepID=A0A842YPE0_METTF|nr:agmatinase [Methanothermobacter thermautotrophicus]MBE2900480.1 agmatinase [Methanothermobacter thermautotrophicus]MCQ8905143.1 agmatinase [Methanothermobacter sp.]